MNAVIGFIKLTLDTPSFPKEFTEHLNIALNSAQALLAIINDILDFSKLEEGKVVIENTLFFYLNCLKAATRYCL